MQIREQLIVENWDPDRTVRLYTEGADQEKMARAAIDRAEKVLSKAGKTHR
ncbi:hypothetical protein [Roseococcus sp.]|uniref:hypothetical protein n=1 Tax=Roseococcus sp. TaxID=2109646 RepID=UPI003BA9FED1